MSMASVTRSPTARRLVRLEAGDTSRSPTRSTHDRLGAGRLDHLDRRLEAADRRRLGRALRIVAREMLRADAEDHLPARSPSRAPASPASGSSVGCAAVQRHRDARAGRRATTSLGRNEIHRRRAHEAGDEHVGRALVDLARLGELLHAALMHDGDARGERHRLDLVVGDVDRGLAEPLVQLLDLGAHLDAQLGVEVGQRLVEQEEQRDRAPARGPWRRAAAGRRRAGRACG